MTNESQSVLTVRGCLSVTGAVAIAIAVVLLVLGVLAANALGGFVGGISDSLSGVAKSVMDPIGQGVENLRDTVDGIGNGVTELRSSVADLPQRVGDSVSESLAGLTQSVSDAVREAIRTERRASIDTRDVLANSIVHLGTLVTASQQIDTDVKVSTEAGLINLCGVSVDHIVEGTIEAGVDLSQVQASDFMHDSLTNNWVLQLGSAQLHSCRIDYIRQQGHSLTVCQQDWDAYRLLAESAALKEIRVTALAEGLLASAELEAERVLGNFLRNVTESENISIAFESEPVADIPESCLREPLAGWKFDEENDSWVQE